MNVSNILEYLLFVSLLNGCVCNQFPATWKSVYVKEHDFQNVALCEVIDILREDSLSALEESGLCGYSIILDKDVSQAKSISDVDVLSHDTQLQERYVSLHIQSQPLAEAFKFLGEELGLDVYYKNGVVFLTEKQTISRNLNSKQEQEKRK